MGDLHAFSGHKSRCHKCASHDVAIQYCRRRAPQRLTYQGQECPAADEAGPVEHFHRSCRLCGFDWTEALPLEDTPA